MNNRKILIVYYSRSGTTRGVARMLADQLDCTIEELVDRKPRAGLKGWFGCARDAMLHRRTDLAEPHCDPADYDLVVIGTPIWARSVSVPVRTYLERYAAGMRDVAFFLTHGGIARERVFEEMKQLSQREPVALLSVTEAQFDRGEYFGLVKNFARTLGTLVTADTLFPAADAPAPGSFAAYRGA